MFLGTQEKKGIMNGDLNGDWRVVLLIIFKPSRCRIKQVLGIKVLV